MRFVRSIILGSIACLSFSTQGQELPEIYNPARPLGMGGAFTAVANDDSAIWTNPAGISRARKARTRDWFIAKVPNLGLGANSRGKDFYNALTGSKDESLVETLDNNDSLGSNKPYWANLQMFPMAMFDYSKSVPGALGMFSNTTTKILIEKENPEQARVEMISDTGGVANVTWTNRTNLVSFGAQARYVMRYAYEDTVPTEDLRERKAMQERVKEDANQSAGIGLDLGMLYTFSDFWFPTLGLSILNMPTGCKEEYLNPHTKERQTICGNLFRGDVANEDALSTVDPTDIRAGLSITPRITRDISLRIALDVHHMSLAAGDKYIGLPGIEPQKMVHAGAELFLGNPLQTPPLAVRAGMNQGFMTGGFSLNLGFFSFDFATYGVDVSSDSKPIEDRRYLGSLTLIF